MLRVERPLRHLLNPPKKSYRLQLDEPPLTALKAALRLSNPTHIESLEIFHGSRVLETDDDLRAILSTTSEKGVVPTLRLAAKRDAVLPAPPQPPEEIPAPEEPQQLLSFYLFYDSPSPTSRLPELTSVIESTLRELRVMGSVYVATEGVNAQLAAPQSVVDALRTKLRAVPELSSLSLNIGDLLPADHPPPFRRILVKERPQVLTDGLPTPLDWQRAGTDLPAEQWGEKLSVGDAVVLDCRNKYETDLGKFEGAEPLDTDVFSESWEKLEKRLENTPKDAPIMTYCTGGIRCVKVNAYLEQTLGFSNTYRLQDGINGYLRHLRESEQEQARDGAEEGSQWIGENFYFDERSAGKTDGVRGGDDADPELN